VQLWTNSAGGCWNACLASLVGGHPSDVPHDDDDTLDLERQNRWLAARGHRLEPVYAGATWGESYPRDTCWIALLARRPGVVHAVIAEGNRIIHDPACSNGGSGNLWPADLAHAHDRTLPLGYRLR
jgi:hypothetical protein